MKLPLNRKSKGKWAQEHISGVLNLRSERTCIVTRKAQPPEGLIRFVASPGGGVVPDLKTRLPGRGAWVSAKAEIVRKAVDKGLFARAMKKPVTPDPELDKRVSDLLKAQMLGALGMAMKTGAVITGFAKVEAALKGQKAQVLIHASDGANEGWRKLESAIRANKHGSGAAYSPPVWVRGISAEDLGLALGRENVVHAALKHGRMAAAFLKAAEKWHRFTGAAWMDGTGKAPESKGAGQEQV